MILVENTYIELISYQQKHCYCIFYVQGYQTKLELTLALIIASHGYLILQTLNKACEGYIVTLMQKITIKYYTIMKTLCTEIADKTHSNPRFSF